MSGLSIAADKGAHMAEVLLASKAQPTWSWWRGRTVSIENQLTSLNFFSEMILKARDENRLEETAKKTLEAWIIEQYKTTDASLNEIHKNNVCLWVIYKIQDAISLFFCPYTEAFLSAHSAQPAAASAAPAPQTVAPTPAPSTPSSQTVAPTPAPSTPSSQTVAPTPAATLAAPAEAAPHVTIPAPTTMLADAPLHQRNAVMAAREVAQAAKGTMDEASVRRAAAAATKAAEETAEYLKTTRFEDNGQMAATNANSALDLLQEATQTTDGNEKRKKLILATAHAVIAAAHTLWVMMKGSIETLKQPSDQEEMKALKTPLAKDKGALIEVLKDETTSEGFIADMVKHLAGEVDTFVELFAETVQRNAKQP